MEIDVFTLFPEWFDWFLGQRHVRNALRLGHDVRLFNYRDTTPLGAGQVDDSPYGGGAGMVIRVDVVDAALQAVYGPDTGALLASRRVAVLAASGRPLDDAVADELAGLDELTLLCGRYEGIDERVTDHLANDLALDRPVRAVRRRARGDGRRRRRAAQAPGALGHAESALEESFSAGSRGRARVPALHAPGVLSRLGGARGASLRASRRGSRGGGTKLRLMRRATRG